MTQFGQLQSFVNDGIVALILLKAREVNLATGFPL